MKNKTVLFSLTTVKIMFTDLNNVFNTCGTCSSARFLLTETGQNYKRWTKRNKPIY